MPLRMRSVLREHESVRPGEGRRCGVFTDHFLEGNAPMHRFRNLSIVALLAGVAMLATPPPARASFAVNVYDDGVLQSGITVFASGNQLVFFGSTTHFDITNGSGLSNNPGSPTTSNLSLSSN